VQASVLKNSLNKTELAKRTDLKKVQQAALKKGFFRKRKTVLAIFVVSCHARRAAIPMKNKKNKVLKFKPALNLFKSEHEFFLT